MQKGGLRTKGLLKNSEKDRPLLSIVTVVFNGERHLEQTIQSVINQTYNNIEYIIIDGGSSDKTIEIIKKYDNKIDFWLSEPDNGIYDAMNKGISLATGEYIELLNADDWLELDACEIIKNQILEEHYDVYHGIERFIDSNGNNVNLLAGTVFTLNTQCLAHETCFIHKSIYEKYKYDINYKSAADYDLICKLNKNGTSFKFVERILLNFRLDGMSSSIRGIFEGYLVRYKYGYLSKRDFLLRKVYYTLKGFIQKKK